MGSQERSTIIYDRPLREKSTQESLAKDLKDKNYSRIKETHTFKNDSACLDIHHYTNIVNKSARVYNKASEILASDSFKKSMKHIYKEHGIGNVDLSKNYPRNLYDMYNFGEDWEGPGLWKETMKSHLSTTKEYSDYKKSLTDAKDEATERTNKSVGSKTDKSLKEIYRHDILSALNNKLYNNEYDRIVSDATDSTIAPWPSAWKH